LFDEFFGFFGFFFFLDDELKQVIVIINCLLLK